MSAYAEAQYVIDELTERINATGMKLQPPTNVSIVNFDEAAKITWTDPEDVVIDGGIAAQWAGTKVVRKVGSAPTSWKDGTLVVDEKVRDTYKTSPFVDTGLTNGTTYYYGIFPYTDIDQYTTSYVTIFTPSAILPATPTLSSVVASDEEALATFVNNSQEALIKIVYKVGSAPTSPTDGTVVDGLSTSPATITGLTNGTTYYFVAYAYTQNRVSSASEAKSATPQAVYPDAPVITSLTPSDQQIEVAFTSATVGALVKLVYKAGSAPQSASDGTVIDGLTTSPRTITGLTNGTKYYVAAYAYTSKRTSSQSNVMNATPNAYVQFAFHYSESDSSPASVTYPAGYDNSDYTDTFYVDLSTGVPHYGDWDKTDDKNKWLFPKPCMLKYDGTVDYYLDENDETKKEDGTASDVANSSYAGNAMIEWGQDGRKLYWKIVPDSDGKGFTFVIASAQVDNDMQPWNHYNCKGEIAEHFYTPIYFGSSDGTRLRSISGGTNYVNNAATAELTLAKANNLTSDEIWNTEVYCDFLLTAMLCILISKSTNSQAKFGHGRCASGNTSAIGQGTMNGKGMFFGKSDQTSGVKVFGMENPWGNLWRRIAGLINANGTVKLKLTYGKQDGSTVEGYNTTGSGYISHGTMTGTSGGYTSHMNITNRGITPETISGSDSTYYCDGAWFNNGQVDYALVGGRWANSLRVGCLYVDLNTAVSDAAPGNGAALSCKPLA